MRLKAVLVSGTEDHHQERTTTLSSYLEHIGCEVTVIILRRNWLLSFWKLWCTAKATKTDEIVLFLYNGHGSRWGWENDLPYFLIAHCLRSIKGKLLVVNDTCYGYHLLRRLKKFRQEEDTGFIAPWDSVDVSYGGVVRDIITYWPRGMRTEDGIEKNYLSTEKGDVEVPIQLRWGAHLDHYFFPD